MERRSFVKASLAASTGVEGADEDAGQPGQAAVLLGQAEEVGGMLGVLEVVRDRLVDRDGARTGGGIGRLAAVDGQAGLIVDCDVTDVPKENLVFLESMDRITENFEHAPERALADAAMGTIANLEGMETRHVDFYTPVESPLPGPGNPALRDDPTVPVAEADWPKMSRGSPSTSLMASPAPGVRLRARAAPLRAVVDHHYFDDCPAGLGRFSARRHRILIDGEQHLAGDGFTKFTG